MLVMELHGRVDVFRLARWNMISALIMTGAASTAFGGWRELTGWQISLLAASSLFGIIIATTAYYATIYAAGPRNTALLFSLASPFALALGYFALGETIRLRQALGVGLVLGGIVLAIGRPQKQSTPLGSRSPGVPWRGISLGVLTAAGQALGSLLARPAMAAGVEPFTAMAVRSGVARGVLLDPCAAAAPTPSPPIPIRDARPRNLGGRGFRRHGARHVAADGGAGSRQSRHGLDPLVHDADRDPPDGLAPKRRRSAESRLGRRIPGCRRHGPHQPLVLGSSQNLPQTVR